MCLALDFNGRELDRVRPLRCIRKRCTLSAMSRRELSLGNSFKWILRPLASLRHSLEFGSVTKRDVISFLNTVVRFGDNNKNIPSPSNKWTVEGERERMRELDAAGTRMFPYDLRKGPFRRWQREHIKIFTTPIHVLSREMSLENVLVIYERMLESLNQIGSDRLGISAALGNFSSVLYEKTAPRINHQEELELVYKTVLMDASWYFFAHLVSLACGGGEARLLNERQRHFEKIKELPLFLGDEGDGDLMNMFTMGANFSERFGTLLCISLSLMVRNIETTKHQQARLR